MHLIEISNIPRFMNRLLLEDEFDDLLLVEAVVNGRFRTEIWGLLDERFFDTGEMPDRKYALWSEVRPIIRDIIKGKRTPVGFKIVLEKDLGSDTGDRKLITLLFKNNELKAVSSVAHQKFTLERSDDTLWDAEAEALLRERDENG